MQVKELREKFATHAATYYRRADGSATGEAATINQAMQALVNVAGGIEINQVNCEMLRTVQKNLIAQGNCRSTINSKIRRIRTVFRWAVSHDFASPAVLSRISTLTPLRRFRTEANESKGVSPIDWASVAATAAAATCPVNSMIIIQWWTGMRSGELVRMRPCDVHQSERGWTYSPQQHKTRHLGRSRSIALGPNARAALEDLRERQGWVWGVSSRPCFLNARCREFTVRVYRRAVGRACNRAGVIRWFPLQLRHAAATRLRSQIGIEMARCVLGHSDANTTLIYAERDTIAAAATMEKFG